MYFFIYGLVLLIFSVFIFLMLNQRFIRSNYYQNRFYQVKKFIDGVPSELEVINTGSSYGKYGFDYSKSGMKGFNFALQPQSLSYDFKILKQYHSHCKPKCKVIIVIPDLVFGFLDYCNDQSNTKYYYFLDKKYIIGYSKMKYLVCIKYPILSAKLRLWHLIKDSNPVNADAISPSKSSHDTEIAAKIRIEGWMKQFQLTDMQFADSAKHLDKIFEQTTKLLSEMIGFCLNKGFEPVIVVPPVSGILNDMISKEFMEEVLYKNIRRANRANIPVLDYLYDERFSDYKLYINADFLNKTGREIFTNVVLSDLERQR